MANPQYVTLVANTVSTLTLDDGYAKVEIVNVDGGGSAPIYATIDGTTPAVATNGSQYVGAAAGSALTLEDRSPGAGPTVKLKSAGTPLVMVRGTNL